MNRVSADFLSIVFFSLFICLGSLCGAQEALRSHQEGCCQGGGAEGLSLMPYCRHCNRYHAWHDSYYGHYYRPFYDDWIKERSNTPLWPSQRNNPLITELSR